MKRFLTTFLLPLGKQGLLVKRICFISHPFRLAAAGVPALRAPERGVCWAGVLSARRTWSTGPCCGCYPGQEPNPGCCRHHITMLNSSLRLVAPIAEDGHTMVQHKNCSGCARSDAAARWDSEAHVVSMQEPNCRCLQIFFPPPSAPK